MFGKQKIQFEVQGSAAEPYVVRFIKSGNNLSAYCTCQAGQNGMYCKHRFMILEGNAENIVGGNKDQVAVVASWLPGSDVEAAMQEVRRMEDEVARIKKLLTNAKKALATAMMD